VITRARGAVAPFYLFCCVVLGSNGQNGWTDMVLQLLGLVLLARAALERAREPLGREAFQLLMLAAVLLVVIALQLVPIPASLWQHLGARQGFATDYRMLGLSVPAFPVSLTPYETLDDALMLVPPLAMFIAVIRSPASGTAWLAPALVAGIAAGMLLRNTQLWSGDGANAVWHLFQWTNFGMGSDRFANDGHMVILVVISLPFIAALFGSPKGANRHRTLILMAIIALVILVGVVANRSLPGYCLAVPVLIACLLAIAPDRSKWRCPGLIVAGLLLIAAIAFNSARPIHDNDLGHVAGSSIDARAQVWTTTARAVGDFMPFGSGMGSFQNVYRLYENPDRTIEADVIHANDDYLEFALEMGLPGILLMIGFLAWWLVAGVDVWRNADPQPFAPAATIASAVILAQSLVDFPLRTAAVSTVFAMCVALMANRFAVGARSRLQLWPTRHVVFE
jgi:hypothetical protein